jgi:hypothetical protein
MRLMQNQSVTLLIHLCVILVLLGVAHSVVLAGLFRSGHFWLTVLSVFSICSLAYGVWLVLKGLCSVRALRERRGGSGGSSGLWGAGKPAPLKPSPTHHLAAAKEWPPSDKTHSWPKD